MHGHTHDKMVAKLRRKYVFFIAFFR